MRVLIIGINYRPDLTGIGPYTADLAEYLAGRGDDVTVADQACRAVMIKCRNS